MKSEEHFLPIVVRPNKKIEKLLDRQIFLRDTFNNNYDFDLNGFLDLICNLYVIQNVKVGAHYTLKKSDLEEAHEFCKKFEVLDYEREMIESFLNNE